MSYVFSKALRDTPEDKERRKTLPSKWNPPNPSNKVAPPVASKPKPVNSNPTSSLHDSGLVSSNAAPRLDTGLVRPGNSHEAPIQSSTGESAVMKALRKTSLPARSYSVDGDDYGTGPKMGGAFARLQFNIAHGDDSKKGLYSDAYEAYKAKKSLKEHGVLPSTQRERLRKYSLDKPSAPSVLPKPRHSSAENKRDSFARNRSMTTPTSPTANFFNGSVEHPKPLTEKTEALPEVFESEGKKSEDPVNIKAETVANEAIANEVPGQELINQQPSAEATEKDNVFDDANIPTTPTSPTSPKKNEFGDPEEIKKLEHAPEVIAMKQEMQVEKTKTKEGKRRLSDTIDELESFDFGLDENTPPAIKEEDPKDTITIHSENEKPAEAAKDEPLKKEPEVVIPQIEDVQPPTEASPKEDIGEQDQQESTEAAINEAIETQKEEKPEEIPEAPVELLSPVAIEQPEEIESEQESTKASATDVTSTKVIEVPEASMEPSLSIPTEPPAEDESKQESTDNSKKDETSTKESELPEDSIEPSFPLEDGSERANDKTVEISVADKSEEPTVVPSESITQESAEASSDISNIGVSDSHTENADAGVKTEPEGDVAVQTILEDDTKKPETLPTETVVEKSLEPISSDSTIEQAAEKQDGAKSEPGSDITVIAPDNEAGKVEELPTEISTPETSTEQSTGVVAEENNEQVTDIPLEEATGKSEDQAPVQCTEKNPDNVLSDEVPAVSVPVEQTEPQLSTERLSDPAAAISINDDTHVATEDVKANNPEVAPSGDSTVEPVTTAVIPENEPGVSVPNIEERHPEVPVEVTTEKVAEISTDIGTEHVPDNVIDQISENKESITVEPVAEKQGDEEVLTTSISDIPQEQNVENNTTLSEANENVSSIETPATPELSKTDDSNKTDSVDIQPPIVSELENTEISTQEETESVENINTTDIETKSELDGNANIKLHLETAI